MEVVAEAADEHAVLEEFGGEAGHLEAVVV